MKPRVAVLLALFAGTISCTAPKASPPCGRQTSIAGKPKGRLRASAGRVSGRGNRRRNSSTTSARGRPWGRAVVIFCRRQFVECSLEQNRNNARGCLEPPAGRVPPLIHLNTHCSVSAQIKMSVLRIVVANEYPAPSVQGRITTAINRRSGCRAHAGDSPRCGPDKIEGPSHDYSRLRPTSGPATRSDCNQARAAARSGPLEAANDN